MTRPRARVHYGNRFAHYYDFIYHRMVNYRGDVAFLEAIFRRFGRGRPQEILDLGCGTGTHAILLARRGYRLTGLDLSRAQLAVARRKTREEGQKIRLVHGNMRSFNLSATFDAAICMFGGFGYLTRSGEIEQCLRSLRRHLRPGGLFVFEFWQRGQAIGASAQRWLHFSGPEFELVRLADSRFNRLTRLLTQEYRFFVFRGDHVIDRFTEHHVVRPHAIPEVRGFLDRSGFGVLGLYGVTRTEKRFRKPRADDFRIMAVARLRARK